MLLLLFCDYGVLTVGVPYVGGLIKLIDLFLYELFAFHSCSFELDS